MMSFLVSFLVLCVVTPYALAISIEGIAEPLFKPVKDSEGIFDQAFVTQPYDNSSSEEPPKVKINWAPVWDDIETSNELGLRYETLNAKCGSTPGKGLRHLIEQAKKLLPLEEIIATIRLYAQDPQIRALEKYLHSPEFKEKIRTMENSTEFKILQSYTCNILHLDILHESRKLDDSSSEESEEKKQGGITALLMEIDFLIPHEKLIQLYKRLLKSDEELVEAVADLKSEEFKQIALNIRNNVPAYQELENKFISIGVPVEGIRTYVDNIFKKL